MFKPFPVSCSRHRLTNYELWNPKCHIFLNTWTNQNGYYLKAEISTRPENSLYLFALYQSTSFLQVHNFQINKKLCWSLGTPKVCTYIINTLHYMAMIWYHCIILFWQIRTLFDAIQSTYPKFNQTVHNILHIFQF